MQTALASKDLQDVTLHNVFGDVFGDDRFIFFERVCVTISHLCGDFEADVDELAEILIIVRMALHVAQCVNVFVGVPAIDFFRSR